MAQYTTLDLDQIDYWAIEVGNLDFTTSPLFLADVPSEAYIASRRAAMNFSYFSMWPVILLVVEKS